jgi:hypothetical protein
VICGTEDANHSRCDPSVRQRYGPIPWSGSYRR